MVVNVANMFEYALIMTQYLWICFNNVGFDWTWQHIPENQSANYAKILNVFDAV